jgi:protein-S-isoprenylcysteine O-methyltransferase Ste14
MKLNPTEASRRRLDVIEQLTVIGLFIWLTSRLLPQAIETGGLLAVVLVLFSEGVVCVLLVFRRATTNISIDFEDWLLAAAGTFLPLLVTKGGDPILGILGPYLLLVGTITHIAAKLTLLRSFGLVAANRGIKVGGLYRYVRHPMYAGYILTHIGFLLASPSLWNAVIYVSAWTLLIARVFAEERILNKDPEYMEYARLVRHRIVPGIY